MFLLLWNCLEISSLTRVILCVFHNEVLNIIVIMIIIIYNNIAKGTVVVRA